MNSPERILTEEERCARRISGPNYLITETNDRYWWLPQDQRPIHITPAHWWER